jgi:hypothetical protein
MFSISQVDLRRLVWLSFVGVFGLAGCGGGDEGGSDAGPALKLSESAIKVSWSTDRGLPFLQNGLRVTIDKPSTADYFIKFVFNGSAIYDITMGAETSHFIYTGNPRFTPTRMAGYVGGMVTATAGPSNGTGYSFMVDHIYFYDPKIVGAGTHSDVLTISACHDSACTRHLGGSPINLPVEYAVTGDPISIGFFSFANALHIEQSSDAVQAPVRTLEVTGQQLPPYGANFVLEPGSGSLISSATFQAAQPFDPETGRGTISVAFKNPAQLGAGLYSDTLRVKVCYDDGCSKQARGSPWDMPISYIVTAAAGKDFTQRTLDIAPQDLVWNPATQRLYVLTAQDSAQHGGSIVEVDPATGTLGRILPLRTDLVLPRGPLAVSGDGQYLYVGMTTASGAQVERVRVSDFTRDLTIPVPNGTASIKVAPGQPQTLAISTENSPSSIVIYDGATARSQRFDAGNYFSWGANNGVLYAYENRYPQNGSLHELAAGPSGLTLTRTVAHVDQYQSFIDSNMSYAGGQLYWDTGTVFDTVSGTFSTPIVGHATTPNTTRLYAVAAAPEIDRAYALTTDFPDYSNPSLKTLQSFRLSDRKGLWITRIASQNLHRPMIRWGTDGLAMVVSTGGTVKLLLISGPVVTQ